MKLLHAAALVFAVLALLVSAIPPSAARAARPSLDGECPPDVGLPPDHTPPGDVVTLLAGAGAPLVAASRPTTPVQDKANQDKPKPKLATTEVQPGKDADLYPAANGWKTWKADAPLTWDDFKGTVDEAERKKGIRAATAAFFDAWWEHSFSECAVQREGRDTGVIEITVKFEGFHSVTVFSPKNSWKDLEGLSAEAQAKLLKHEQGHFDLAEVFRRRWQKRADELAAKLTAEQKEKKARTVERLREQTRAKLLQDLAEALKEPLQELEQLKKDLIKQLGDANALYDSFTEHGTVDANQAEWNTWIGGQLGATPPGDAPPGTKK